ncbi:MAG: pilus assembly protein [Chloroflexi bacterium]|nr:pilus assembly protein [Chloroflexota bacterium]
MRSIHFPPKRSRGQAMVEFGLVGLLLVLMLFGIVDFGMLLNGWMNVSTGSAAGARWAALGNLVNDSSSPTVNGIYSQAKASSIVPGLSTSNIKVIVTYTSSSGAYGPTTYCRGYSKVVQDGTTTPIVSLTPPAVPTYQYDPLDANGNKVKLNGTNLVCAGEPSGDNPPDSTTTPAATPAAGDSIQVTVIADNFEVITPLVRPFFGCSTSQQHCYVPLTSSTTMRYEGSLA